MTTATRILLREDNAYLISLIDGTRYPYALVFEGFSFDSQQGPIAKFSWYDDESGQSGDLDLAPVAIASVELYRA